MTIKEALNLATDLKNKHSELSNWTITLNRRKRSFGVCSYTKREIQLSSELIPVMSDKAIFETIVHEIAHALTKGDGHGYYWKRCCISLGGDGQRCGNSDKFEDGNLGRIQFHKTASKYTLTCPSCGNQSFVNRLPKRACSCGLHGRGFNPLHKMVLSQNY